MTGFASMDDGSTEHPAGIQGHTLYMAPVLGEVEAAAAALMTLGELGSLAWGAVRVVHDDYGWRFTELRFLGQGACVAGDESAADLIASGRWRLVDEEGRDVSSLLRPVGEKVCGLPSGVLWDYSAHLLPKLLAGHPQAQSQMQERVERLRRRLLGALAPEGRGSILGTAARPGTPRGRSRRQ